MFQNMMWIALLTMTPFIELRGGIPYGILILNMPVWTVVLTAVVTNILIGVAAYFFIDRLIWLLRFLPPVERFYHRTVERMQKKITPFMEKYCCLGLALFIGIPLPMSGVFSGAIIGKLLGMRFRNFLISVIIGVCMAAIIVTSLTLTGQSLASIFIKPVI